MRGTLTPTAAYYRANHDRYTALVTEHVTPLGCQIAELVGRQEHEVVAWMDDQWPFAHRGRPNCDAGEGVLAIRDIEYPRFAELQIRGPRRSEDSLVIVDADSGDEDVGVLPHGLHGAFGDGLPVLQPPHDRAPNRSRPGDRRRPGMD